MTQPLCYFAVGERKKKRKKSHSRSMSCTFLMGRRKCQDKCLQLVFLVRVWKCWHYQIKMVPPAWAGKEGRLKYISLPGDSSVKTEAQTDKELPGKEFISYRVNGISESNWPGRLCASWVMGKWIIWLFVHMRHKNAVFRKPRFRGKQHRGHLHRKRRYATFTGDILNPKQWLACFRKPLA